MAETKVTLSVDLGATNLRVGIVSLDGNGNATIIDQVKGPSPANDKDRLLKTIVDMTHEVLEKNPSYADVDRVGVSACGLIDHDKTAIFLPNLHVSDVPIADALIAAFPRFRVKVANDANASALSEFLLGAGKGSEDMIFVTISSGIGMGYVYHGELINATLEIGHCMTWDNQKPVEYEQYLSGNGISRLCQHMGLGTVKGGEFFQLVKAKDPKIMPAYDYWIKGLGMLFGNLQRLFNVDCYVLSGGVMKSKAVFFEDFEKVCNGFLYPYPLKSFVFKDAKFGQDAGLMGGAAVGFSIKDSK